MDQNQLVKKISEHIGAFTIEHGEKFSSVFGFAEFLQASIEREFSVVEIFLNASGEEIGRKYPGKEVPFCGHTTEQCDLPKELDQEPNHILPTPTRKELLSPFTRRGKGVRPGTKRGPYKKSVPTYPVSDKLSYVNDEEKHDLKDLKAEENPRENARKKQKYIDKVPYAEASLKPQKKTDLSLEVEVSGPGVPKIVLKQNDPEAILNDNGEYQEDEEEF